MNKIKRFKKNIGVKVYLTKKTIEDKEVSCSDEMEQVILNEKHAKDLYDKQWHLGYRYQTEPLTNTNTNDS